MYGNNTKVMDKYEVIFKYSDLSEREFIVLSLMTILVLFAGFYPNMFLDPINISTSHYLNMYSNSFYGSL